MNYEKLEIAGLTKNESKVYYNLLKKGESSANEISKNLGIDRTLTYTILNHLIEKGQVNYIIKENKKIFSCANPDNLLNSIKAKELLITSLITELKNVIPEKRSESKINIYEGIEGIRTYINLILKEKEFCAFGSTGMKFFSLYEMPHLTKKIEKMNINIRIIGNKKYKKTESLNFKKFNYKYLNIESSATTSIFGYYVVIHLIKDKPLLIIIKDKEIAKSYQNHFEFLWNKAKLIK